MVREGRFRADLYYRLSGVEIVVPPLRARRDDIPLLVDHFLRIYGRETLSVDPVVREALFVYDWPGNVRQLARVLERAIALAQGPEIALMDLPEALRTGLGPVARTEEHDDTLRAWRGRYVRLVLDRCGGNKRRACDILDISYHTLRSHLAYGRSAAETRAESPLAADTRVANGGAPDTAVVERTPALRLISGPLTPDQRVMSDERLTGCATR
jgi:transcriptional regulator with PAS, ATPase and Fis domain